MPRPLRIRLLLLLVPSLLVAVGCGGNAGNGTDTGGAATGTGTAADAGGTSTGQAEDEPPIVVETPEDFDVVVRRLHLSGEAQVFEANVSWQVRRSEHEVVTEGFVTAECGAPCRGRFDETIDLVRRLPPGNYVLEVFAQNVASDGEGTADSTGDDRIGLVQIPFAFYHQPEAEGPKVGGQTGPLDAPPPPPA